MTLRTAKLLIRLGWWYETIVEMFGFRSETYLGYQESKGSPCQYYVRDGSGMRRIEFRQIPEGRFVTFIR